MGRAPCCDKANVKRGPWSPEEDATLKSYLQTHGTGGNWIALPRKAGLRRCGKSCRLRWLNYLRPDIKHGGFTEDEDRTICGLYNQMGSRWSVIASQLPGRTDNDVKNYWNTKLKKKLLAGKITLTSTPIPTTTTNATSINATAINNQPKPHNLNFVQKLETDEFSSSCPNSRSTQNQATLRPSYTDVHYQRQSFSYDQSSSVCSFSPRGFMDFSNHDQFYYSSNLISPKINSHIINHVSFLSQDQLLGGSGNDIPVNSSSPVAVNGVKSLDGREEYGATALVDFGFGLPYDILF